MRYLFRFFGAVLALIFLAVVGASIWLQDANHLKPEIEALITKNSAYEIHINGSLDWQLLPPLKLNITNLQAASDELNIVAGQVELDLDLSAIWRDLDHWQVNALTLTDTKIVRPDDVIDIASLTLASFSLNQPADFSLIASQLTTRSDEEISPLSVELEGVVTYTPATTKQPERISFTNTQLTSEVATGLCNIYATDAKQQNGLVTPPTSTAQDILPIDVLASYDLSADCQWQQIIYNNKTFTDATLELSNVNGHLDILLDMQDFFAGTMELEVSTDYTQTPIEWLITPQVSNVDSEQFMQWSEQNLQWAAPVGLNGDITLQGNTEAELVNSISAQTDFDGGQGQINITKIKQQLLEIAMLTGNSDDVSTWPDVWDYQQFTGRWVIDGPLHKLNFAIDHMSVEAEGEYHYFDDGLNMLGHVTLHEPAPDSPFRINPLLQDTPIPIRCKGPSSDPKCRLDEKASQQIIARALADDESGMRRKLEEKIDEKVPEEYREAARSLLDLLGRSLEED